LSLQVRKHIVEAHADVPSNVLSNDPRGPEFSHEPTKFRPEMAVILLASSLPGCGERLAWVSPANNVNCSNVRPFQFSNIFIARNIGPMFGKNLAGEFFNLAKSHRLKAAGAFKSKAEASDARE
jgi:hypothetical protein